MDAVKSKLRTAVWLRPTIFLTGAIACWWFFISIGPNQKDGRLFLFFAILLTFFGAGLIYTYLTKNPAITISDEGINLDYALSDGRFINWNEVEKINAVQPNPFFGDEGSMI